MISIQNTGCPGSASGSRPQDLKQGQHFLRRPVHLSPRDVIGHKDQDGLEGLRLDDPVGIVVKIIQFGSAVATLHDPVGCQVDMDAVPQADAGASGDKQGSGIRGLHGIQGIEPGNVFLPVQNLFGLDVGLYIDPGRLCTGEKKGGKNYEQGKNGTFHLAGDFSKA
ncbi:MAG: hypothetical protein R2751_02655 [Bacteroidales bacterium]